MDRTAEERAELANATRLLGRALTEEEQNLWLAQAAMMGFL